MKEKLIQTKEDPPPMQKVVREVLTQTPALVDKVTTQIQTQTITKNSEIQTVPVSNEIKVQTDHVEEKEEDTELKQQLQAEEWEVRELEKRLNEIPEAESSYSSESEEVRIFEDQEVEV